MIILLFVSFFVLLILGVPVALSLAGSSILALYMADINLVAPKVLLVVGWERKGWH